MNIFEGKKKKKKRKNARRAKCSLGFIDSHHLIHNKEQLQNFDTAALMPEDERRGGIVRLKQGGQVDLSGIEKRHVSKQAAKQQLQQQHQKDSCKSDRKQRRKKKKK